MKDQMVYIMTNTIDIKQQYEYYFTEDLPIPYTPKSGKKRIKEIQKKIEEIKAYLNKLNKEELLDEKNGLLARANELIENYKEEINNQTLLIHPVLMADYFLFYSSVSVLTLDKNKIADPNIIAMSDLDYIFYLTENDKAVKII